MVPTGRIIGTVVGDVVVSDVLAMRLWAHLLRCVRAAVLDLHVRGQHPGDELPKRSFHTKKNTEHLGTF